MRNQITDDDIQHFRCHPHMDVYQTIAKQTSVYPGIDTPLGLNYVTLKLASEAGEFAGHLGKAIRDDGFMQSSGDYQPYIGASSEHYLLVDRYNHLVLELGDVLWYLSAAAKELGLTLSDIAEKNLEKLQDRASRDQLQGSGDDR